MWRKMALLLIVAVTLLVTAEGQTSLTILRADPAIVLRRLSNPPATQAARIERLRKQLKAAKTYADFQLTEQNVPEQEVPSLIWSIKGAEDACILVAVNTQSGEKKDELEEKWVSVAMLPLLSETLGAVAFKHTLTFAAFTGGKGKKSGAGWYLKQLSKEQRKNIRAVVELDDLGKGMSAYAPTGKGRKLAKKIPEMASAFGLELPVDSSQYEHRPEDWVGPIASEFGTAGVPGVTFRSFPSQYRTVDYYKVYLMLSMYLRQLDADLAKSDQKAEIKEQKITVREISGPQ